MNLLFRFILLALFLPMSALAENPCLVAWGNIDTNLTDNHGCTNEDYPEYRPLCEAFSKCIRSFDICVVSDGEVFGGNSIKDFPLRSASITFGINRTLATKQDQWGRTRLIRSSPSKTPPQWGIAFDFDTTARRCPSIGDLQRAVDGDARIQGVAAQVFNPLSFPCQLYFQAAHPFADAWGCAYTRAMFGFQGV